MFGAPKLPAYVAPPAPPTQASYLAPSAPGLAASGGGRMGNTFLTGGMVGMPSTSGQKTLTGQ